MQFYSPCMPTQMLLLPRRELPSTSVLQQRSQPKSHRSSSSGWTWPWPRRSPRAAPLRNRCQLEPPPNPTQGKEETLHSPCSLCPSGTLPEADPLPQTRGTDPWPPLPSPASAAITAAHTGIAPNKRNYWFAAVQAPSLGRGASTGQPVLGEGKCPF